MSIVRILEYASLAILVCFVLSAIYVIRSLRRRQKGKAVFGSVALGGFVIAGVVVGMALPGMNSYEIAFSYIESSPKTGPYFGEAPDRGKVTALLEEAIATWNQHP